MSREISPPCPRACGIAGYADRTPRMSACKLRANRAGSARKFLGRHDFEAQSLLDYCDQMDVLGYASVGGQVPYSRNRLMRFSNQVPGVQSLCGSRGPCGELGTLPAIQPEKSCQTDEAGPEQSLCTASS